MKLVIVTGMSGAGKTIALKMLEDQGFYCVDNLPIPLLEKFVELIAMPNKEISKVAIGLDVRTDQSFSDVGRSFENLERNGFQFEILFMEASDAVLIRRYKESRRMHPLSSYEGGRVEDGIRRERRVLESMKKKADYVIDTSNLLTRVLKEELDRIFVRNEEYNSLMVTVMSFGFKNGIPSDADLIFDVRFLPNPFYIDDLKRQTGNDRPVRDYVMGFPESAQFLEKLSDMLLFLIPNYVKEGKYQLIIGIGCTGGKHRSVTLANELYLRLKDQGNYGLTIQHRDVKNGI